MKRRSFITGLIGTTLGLGAASITAAAPRLQDESLSSSLTLDTHGRGAHPYHKLLLHATVMATGMTEAEVRTELQAGKSLQAVAESKGKTAAEVIASARTTLKTRLDQEVKDGNITQAQEDTRLADFDSKAPQLMQQTGDPKTSTPRGTGREKRGDSHQHLLLSATATVTGLTEAQVHTELQAGKSLTQVAESKGKTAAEVIASARTTLKIRLDQGVKDGNITQAQADTRLADFDSKAPQLMQQTGGAGNGRGPKPGNGRGTKPGQNENPDSGSTDG